MGVLALGRMLEGCEIDLGPSEPKTVAALDVQTGDQEWSRRLRGPGSVRVGGTVDGLVILRDPRGAIRALELDDGEDVWIAEPPGGAASIPVVLGDAVIVLGCDAALYAYDSATGTRRWTTESAVAGDDFWESSGLGERSLGLSVVASQHAIVTAGAHDPMIRAFDPPSGSPLWQARLFGGVRDAPVVAGERVFVTDETGTSYAFELTTGTLAWARPDERAQEYLTAELVPAGEVVGIPDMAPGGGSNEMIFVDVNSGAERWRTSAPNLGPFGHANFGYDSRSGVLYQSSLVFVDDGTVAREAATGAPRGTVTRREAVAILAAGERLLLEGVDGVHAFDAASGTELWSAYGGWDEARPSAYADDMVVVTLGEKHDSDG